MKGPAESAGTSRRVGERVGEGGVADHVDAAVVVQHDPVVVPRERDVGDAEIVERAGLHPFDRASEVVGAVADPEAAGVDLARTRRTHRAPDADRTTAGEVPTMVDEPARTMARPPADGRWRRSDDGLISADACTRTTVVDAGTVGVWTSSSHRSRCSSATSCATSPRPRSRPTPPTGTATTASRSKRCSRWGALGLFGLPFPEEYGGGGADYLTYCLAIEELARVDASMAITLEAGVSLGASPFFYIRAPRNRSRSTSCR